MTDVICSNCGEQFRDIDGKSYNVGRRTIWMCPECSRKGHNQAVMLWMRQHNRIKHKANKDNKK